MSLFGNISFILSLLLCHYFFSISLNFSQNRFLYFLCLLYIRYFSFLNSVFFSTSFFQFCKYLLKLSVCLFFIYLSVYYTYTTSFGFFCLLLFKLFFIPNYKFSYKFNNPTVYTKNRIKFSCLFPFLKKELFFYLSFSFLSLSNSFFCFLLFFNFIFSISTLYFSIFKPFSIKFSLFQSFPFFHFSLLLFTFIYIPLYSICLRNYSELRA